MIISLSDCGVECSDNLVDSGADRGGIRGVKR
jgi:hypothetical protein